MKVTFVSEITDHIVFAIDITKQELRNCETNAGNTVQALVDTILTACPQSANTPFPASQPKVLEKPVVAPFQAKNYRGVILSNVQTAQRSAEEIRELLLDKIIESNEFCLSEEWIEKETDQELISRSQQLKYQGMIDHDFQRYYNYGTEEDRNEARRCVIRKTQVEMLLKSIIEQENLDATAEELEVKAEKIVQQENTPIDMVKRFFGEDFSLLKGDLLKEKALNLIYESAIFSDK